MSQVSQTTADLVPLDDAQSKLVADNLGVAYFLALRFGRNRPNLKQEFEDAAIDGLIDAARSYNPARGLAFGTLAGKCIRNRIIYRIKYLNIGVRRPELPILSLDHGDGDTCVLAVEDPGIVDDGPDYEAMIAPLDDREKVIMRGRSRDGLTLQAIGDHLGITRERVRQIEGQALRKLALLLDEEGRPCAKLPAPFSRKTPEIRPSGASRPAENAYSG